MYNAVLSESDMAYTAQTGFRYWRSMTGAEPAPIPTPIRVANSTTLRVGDLVRVNTAGFVVPAGAGAAIAGVVTGLVDERGITPWSLGYGTRTGSTLTGDDTLATSATNQTRSDYIQAEVILDPAGTLLWISDADGDLAQTNLFQFFDCDANSRQVASGTASDTNGQVQLVIWDPEGVSNIVGNVKAADASKGAFRIVENQFGLGVDSGTAKLAA